MSAAVVIGALRVKVPSEIVEDNSLIFSHFFFFFAEKFCPMK